MPNYKFRRRMAVQTTLWLTLLGILFIILNLFGCHTEPVIIEKENWKYAETNWKEPKERLQVAVEQLKQLD